MTDDLFDDFDLKKTADEPTDAGVDSVSETAAAEPLNSQDMHPDIFNSDVMPETEKMSDEERNYLSSMIDEEENPSAKVFSFSDDEKSPFSPKEDFIQEELMVEIRTIDKVRRPDVAIDPEHFGETLRRMRESACVSLADLSEELRIKESFLAALEQEDYDNLPPEVFIVAYIRKLGGVYHLTEDEILALSQKVRDRMDEDLPDDMDKVVTLYEHSEENDNKVRHIIILFCVLTLLVLLLIGSGIYFFVSSKNKDNGNVTVMPEKAKQTRFSSDTLLKLQPQVKLDTPALKISK